MESDIVNREWMIADYLLNHQEGLKQWLEAMLISPPSNPEFQDFFEDLVVEELCDCISQALHLDIETVKTTLDKPFLVRLCGKNLFNF